jgi:predicted  nucleic acid-binding Zn-ribbon protein
MAELSSLRQALAAAETERDEARAALSALRAEHAMLTSSLEDACEALEQAEAARDAARRELTEMRGAREQAELALAAAQIQLQAAQDKLEENIPGFKPWPITTRSPACPTTCCLKRRFQTMSACWPPCGCFA